jgi:hypothetical protein
MIVQIIGYWCLFHVVIGEIALFSSVIDKDVTSEGARARVGFLNVAYIAVAAWCLK